MRSRNDSFESAHETSSTLLSIEPRPELLPSQTARRQWGLSSAAPASRSLCTAPTLTRIKTRMITSGGNVALPPEAHLLLRGRQDNRRLANTKKKSGPECNQNERRPRLKQCQIFTPHGVIPTLRESAVDTLPGAIDGHVDFEHLEISFPTSSANRITKGGEDQSHQRAR